ncbi:MAG: glycerophosphodiester phosphodiesterase [Solirubrobacteraceae bacterium]|nr:glycerophosphodiester phosphodiesterase [Solirubrobacteraceae bacterium]
MSLISAHRCGAQADRTLENTREALELAVRLEVEYVEFDVQRCIDGTFVLYHDDHVEIDGTGRRLDTLTFEALSGATSQLVRYDEALRILADGGKRAHIDLKFVSPDGVYADPAATYEVEATALALDTMGAGAFIITSLEDRTVFAIRRWAKDAYPDLLVGLSLGRDMTGRRRSELWRTRYNELFPRTRIKACDANLVVANKTLARLTLAGFAKRERLPLLVWTVDEAPELGRWIDDPRTWMVTTNFPGLAAQLRERRRSPR